MHNIELLLIESDIIQMSAIFILMENISLILLFLINRWQKVQFKLINEIN